MNYFKQLAVITTLTMSFNCLANENPDNIWVTIDSTAAQHYQHEQDTFLQKIPFSHRKSSPIPDVDLLSVPSNAVNNLSEFMHHNYNRCGGFVAHSSFEEASDYAKQLAVVQNSQALLAYNYSIDNAQTVQSLINAQSPINLQSTVNSLTNFNNRYYTSQTGVDASQWLQSYWQQIATTRSDITIESYQHSWAQSSVIVTIAGAENADELVIIGGHLDSINQANPAQGRSPGADDNASGIAVLTEALKAIVETNYKPQKTIKIMAFAAEEVGLRGSKDIASSYRAQGKNVVGMVQFDMTGNNGSIEDIIMMTDYTNNAQNQFLAQLIDTYLPQISYGFDQCGYGCSDHASWYQQGFAASMPFESKMNDINPLIHTQNDSNFDADHAIKFANLAVSFVAELAKNAGDVTPPSNNELVNGEPISGINATAKEQLIYTLNVPKGAQNLSFETSGDNGDADLYVKFNQAPTLSDFDCKSTSATSNERCDIPTSDDGTYYVMVEAYSAINNISLIGSFEQAGALEPINRVEDNISVNTGDWQRYEQRLVAGYSSLNVAISGGTGDADLYLNFDAPSSNTKYVCRPYKNGNTETCTVSAPQAGLWYIDIKGYRNANGITLTINAE